MTRNREGWRTDPGRPLLAVLLMMLVLSGILAYQAWDAARSHRRVTEAALRDYAGFALWELQRRTESTSRMTLTSALMPALAGRMVVAEMLAPGRVARFGVGEPHATEPELVSFGSGVRNALRACGCEGAPSHFFTIDLQSAELEIDDPGTDAELQSWLRSDFLEQARSAAETMGLAAMVQTQTQADGRIMLRAESPDNLLRAQPVPFDPSLVVIYTAIQRDARQRLFGFVLDLHAYARPLIADAVSGPPLLPPALTGSVRNDEVLSVTARTPAGDTIFAASGALTPATEVVDTLQLVAGSLVAGVAVRPEMAGRLVIGGLPASRFPVLLGSFGLTLVLIVIAALQLQRQQELFRLRSDFVSGVSHELRTPLAQVRLFADLLASGRLDERQRERSLRILTEESQRLTYLVENVLRFSRSERLAERVSPVPTQIAPLMREIIDDFRPLARSKEVELELTVRDGIEAPVDSDALRQVILNLLDNAVKYGPRDQRVDVRAAVEGEWLRIEVDDRGPGIPAEERKRVWEPYRRLEREIESATGGSGIGLAVVSELVALHGGSAEVLERPGGGSRFAILLPGAATAISTGAESIGTTQARAEV